MPLRALVLLALVPLFAAACGKAEEPVPDRPTATPTLAAASTPGERTVTDMMGREVQVPATVSRVAALSPSAAEFAAALGLEVVTRSSDTPESVAPGAKAAGSAISPDFNAVAGAQPGLVIADAAYHSGRTPDFDRFAYPVFVLKVGSYADVLTALTALGEATGQEEAAGKARETLESRAATVIEMAQARAARGAPTVLILTGGGKDVFAGGSATYPGSLVETLKGVNVLGSTPQGGPIAGFGVVDVGQAAVLNPDVVLTLSSGQGGLAAQVKADAAWANSPAVRQGRVYELDISLFLRAPGPRAAEALETLFRLLFP